MKKILCFIVFLPSILIAQHKISGVFSPANEFTYALLYHSTPTGTKYIDKSKVDPDGRFLITLDASSPTGIYKIVYALPQEENNFDFIYDGKEDVSLSFDLEKGLEFKESNENKLWSSYTKSMELVNTAISNYYTKESTDENAFEDIFKTLKETQEAYENASKGTLASTFIKSNKPYIPSAFEDVTTYSNNLKRTYLQNVDFENPLLQSSEFLTDRVLAYVFGMSMHTNNDAYKNDVNKVMLSLENTNTSLKISLLQLLWQRFSELENETLANYISDTYLYALAIQNNYTQLIEVLIGYKNNSLGKKAQNFELTNSSHEKPITLYDLTNADRYLIVFWSSTCEHCLEELPQLKKIIPKNTKVIAIGLEDDSINWEKEIKKYPDFIHVLGLEKWSNPIANAYNVRATPWYIVLDKDKNIIAKPFDIDALKKYLSQ
jgi:thiol-disulfide isomerase/thioredoxin